MAAEIKLVASDLDHTLLTPTGELTAGTAALIDRLAALNIIFVPVSGRDLPTLSAMFPQAKWLIAHNGAITASHRRIVQARLLPAAVVHAVITTAEQLGAIPVLCRLNGTELLEGHADQTRQLRRFFTRVTEVSAFRQVGDVAKITLLVAPARLLQVQATVKTRFGSRLQVTAGEADALGITAAGVNKGQALTELAQA